MKLNPIQIRKILIWAEITLFIGELSFQANFYFRQHGSNCANHRAVALRLHMYRNLSPVQFCSQMNVTEQDTHNSSLHSLTDNCKVHGNAGMPPTTKPRTQTSLCSKSAFCWKPPSTPTYYSQLTHTHSLGTGRHEKYNVSVKIGKCGYITIHHTGKSAVVL